MALHLKEFLLTEKKKAGIYQNYELSDLKIRKSMGPLTSSAQE